MILVNCMCINMLHGDTGNIWFSKLPKDKNYNVYFSIFDTRTHEIKREFLLDEFIQAEGKALLLMDKLKSDSLPIGRFNWGLKICAADGTEDTIVPEIGEENGVYFRKEAPIITIGARVALGDI